MIQIHHTNRQSGFTLVELTLSVAFIGFLVLFTVLATLQVMRTYNKGLAVKEINQTSRTVVDELSRAIRAATFTTVNTAPNDASPSQYRVCISGISYVWNTDGGNLNKYSSAGNPAVTFVRVSDPGQAMCSQVSGSYPNVSQDGSTQLLTNRVWVQSLTITKDGATNLATITLQLSTSDDPVSPLLETLPNGDVRCRGQAGDQFCAVATLTTTVAMRGDE